MRMQILGVKAPNSWHCQSPAGCSVFGAKRWLSRACTQAATLLCSVAMDLGMRMSVDEIYCTAHLEQPRGRSARRVWAGDGLRALIGRRRLLQRLQTNHCLSYEVSAACRNSDKPYIYGPAEAPAGPTMHPCTLRRLQETGHMRCQCLHCNSQSKSKLLQQPQGRMTHIVKFSWRQNIKVVSTHGASQTTR